MAMRLEVLLLRISASIGAVCTGTILILSLISLWENRHEISLSQSVHHWRLPLLCSVIFSFTVFCLDGSTVWKQWNEGEGCQYMSIFITLCYVLEKQFLNLFLYDRAKIVHVGLSMEPSKAKVLKFLRWALWLTLVVGIPVCFYWAAFVALAAKVLPDGECLFYATMPIIPIVFAVADSFLAAGMLIIFLVPLWEHQEAFKNTAMPSGNNKFNVMIRRNVRFSLLAIVSGVCGLSMLALFNWLYDGTSATQQFPTWGLFCISWDNLISTIA